MQKALLTANILTVLLALVFVGIAGERAVASNHTTRALKTTQSGMVWDSKNPAPIGRETEQQSSNTDLVQTQQSSVNFWIGLGIAMSMLTASLLGILREHLDERESQNNPEVKQ